MELLPDWILYHAGIFGYDNLYIIDHMSTRPPVQNLLLIAETMGVHVIEYDGLFKFKAETLSQTMKDIFANDSSVDIIIPLDVDEFVVGQEDDNRTFTTSHSVVEKHIKNLPNDGFKYKFDHIQASACSVEEVALQPPNERRVLSALYFSRPSHGPHHKTFYHRQGFMSTDQGNHAGRVEADSTCIDLLEGQADAHGLDVEGEMCYHRTPLAIVHYGTTAQTFHSWSAKMKRGARALGYDVESPCDTQPNFPRGVHYCRAIKELHDDLEESRRKFERSVCAGQLRYSTFMARALMMDYTSALDFKLAPDYLRGEKTQDS